MQGFPVQLTPEDCSFLGKLVLRYMEEQDITMSELARKSGVSRGGVRLACLQGTNLTDSTLEKLAIAMGKQPSELYLLVYADRLVRASQSVPEQVFDGIQNHLTQAVSDLSAYIENPSENELIELAIQVIQLLKANKISSEKDHSRAANARQKQPSENLFFQATLARRLNCSEGTLNRNRHKPDFAEWTRARDPEGMAWQWSEKARKYFPLQQVSSIAEEEIPV